MGSVNISIKEEAYKFLQAIKASNESFSDAILKFKEKKGSKENLMRFFGALSDKDINWDEKERKRKEFREEVEKRLEK